MNRRIYENSNLFKIMFEELDDEEKEEEIQNIKKLLKLSKKEKNLLYDFLRRENIMTYPRDISSLFLLINVLNYIEYPDLNEVFCFLKLFEPPYKLLKNNLDMYLLKEYNKVGSSIEYVLEHDYVNLLKYLHNRGDIKNIERVYRNAVKYLSKRTLEWLDDIGVGPQDDDSRMELVINQFADLTNKDTLLFLCDRYDYLINTNMIFKHFVYYISIKFNYEIVKEIIKMDKFDRSLMTMDYFNAIHTKTLNDDNLVAYKFLLDNDFFPYTPNGEDYSDFRPNIGRFLLENKLHFPNGYYREALSNNSYDSLVLLMEFETNEISEDSWFLDLDWFLFTHGAVACNGIEINHDVRIIKLLFEKAGGNFELYQSDNALFKYSCTNLNFEVAKYIYSVGQISDVDMFVYFENCIMSKQTGIESAIHDISLDTFFSKNDCIFKSKTYYDRMCDLLYTAAFYGNYLAFIKINKEFRVNFDGRHINLAVTKGYMNLLLYIHSMDGNLKIPSKYPSIEKWINNLGKKYGFKDNYKTYQHVVSPHNDQDEIYYNMSEDDNVNDRLISYPNEQNYLEKQYTELHAVLDKHYVILDDGNVVTKNNEIHEDKIMENEMPTMDEALKHGFVETIIKNIDNELTSEFVKKCIDLNNFTKELHENRQMLFEKSSISGNLNLSKVLYDESIILSKKLLDDVSENNSNNDMINFIFNKDEKRDNRSLTQQDRISALVKICVIR